MAPPVRKWALLREALMHTVFVLVLVFAVRSKRDVAQDYSFFEAMQTVFVEENFGDFNEKAFADVSNFGEVWQWTEGVLMPGLFDSDIDTGESNQAANVMMYNRLVGGVQLRQLRVRNDSCTLSSSQSRRIRLGSGANQRNVTQDFIFPAGVNFTGQCFSSYTKDARSTDMFGPCTESGRAALDALSSDVAGINKYNQSCAGSGFEFTAATDAPAVGGKLTTYDPSGYVRNIVPEGLRAYLLQRDTMQAALDELKNFLWLDLQTRAYMISFSVYNGNYNSYAYCRFLFEFSPGGTVIPTFQIKVLKQEVYENAMGSMRQVSPPI